MPKVIIIDYFSERGLSLNRIIREVIDISTKLDEPVHVKINGVEMVASPGQSSAGFMRAYRAKLKQQIVDLKALLPAKQLTQI